MNLVNCSSQLLKKMSIPSFYYPPCYDFYTKHVTNVLACKNPNIIMKLLDPDRFIRHINKVLDLFTCSYKDVAEWAEEDVVYGQYEMEDQSLDDKINDIIRYDPELSWWERIGTHEDTFERKRFEKNIWSTSANSILTVALSHLDIYPSLTNSITTFINKMNELGIEVYKNEFNKV